MAPIRVLRTVSYAGATSAEKELWRGAPQMFYKHEGANYSPGNPAPERNPGRKRTRTGAVFKKFIVKTTLK
jgi:hypothetical protein